MGYMATDYNILIHIGETGDMNSLKKLYLSWRRWKSRLTTQVFSIIENLAF